MGHQMWLSKLTIINYRSCQCLQLKFRQNEPNIFIGINDCGKSSVLLAIGLLLDFKARFYFQSDEQKKCDISNTRLSETEFQRLFQENGWPILPYTKQECMVIGELKVETGDEVVNVSNSLRWVLEEDNFETVTLARIFSENELSDSFFILSKDRFTEPKELFTATKTVLNQIKKDLNIQSDEIVNENQVGPPTNFELMKAVYNRFDDLEVTWTLYKPDNKDDKGFWPQYRYLDWNVSLDELTQFANETLGAAIESQITEASKFANNQAEEAQKIVNRELETFTNNVTDDLPHIIKFKANIAFQVKSKVTDLLVEKENADGDVHLDSQGEGIKRQLWFALLKYKALHTLEDVDHKRFIWCFDEPETHLYPRAQREFFDIIKRLTHGNVQTLLSTHSTVFIDRAHVSQITRTDLTSGYTVVAKCSEVNDIFESLQLRNSDFLFYDRFLIAEGATEIALLKRLYVLYTGRTLLNDNIQLINLGGKDKRQQNLQILKNILNDFQKESSNSIVTILDSDAQFGRKGLTSKEISQFNCYLVGSQDIEDSLPASVWVNIVASQYGEHIKITVQDVENIVSKIPKEEEVQSNNKFYRQFCEFIRNKFLENELDELANSGIFPSKGEDWGNLIGDHIQDVDQIPSKIKRAFDHLQQI